MMSTSRTFLCALLLALSSIATVPGALAAPTVDPTPDVSTDPAEDSAITGTTALLQTDLTALRTAQSDARAAHERARARADRLRRLVARNEAQVEQARLIVGQFLRTIYMNGPTDLSVLASMIDSDDPGDVIRRADEALRVGNHKDDQYRDAVELLRRNEEIRSAAETAEAAAAASLQSIENQMLGLQRQIADGVGAWADHLAGEGALFDPEQARRNSEAAEHWAKYLRTLADWKVPSVTIAEMRKGRLPEHVRKLRGSPGIAEYRFKGRRAIVLPDRVVASVTYAISKLGANYGWRSNTDSRMDCSSLVDRSWNIPMTPENKRTDERDLIRGGVNTVAVRTRLVATKRISVGDLVFVADPGRGVNHVGIKLDDTTMLAADATTGSVNAVDIPTERIWAGGRQSVQAPKHGNKVPTASRQPFQCGADPDSFVTLPDGRTLSNPATCPASAVFGEAYMQHAAILVGRCAASIWPQIPSIGGWRPSDPYPDHPSGRAVDIMMPDGCSTEPANVNLGGAIATFFMQNADRFDVEYIIWHQRIWINGSELLPPDHWRGMSNRGGCTANHMDHVHVSVVGPNVNPNAPDPTDDQEQPDPDTGGNDDRPSEGTDQELPTGGREAAWG